jgi:hypothetical protein
MMASGAPTESLVDPIYLFLCGPLLIAFGVGVAFVRGRSFRIYSFATIIAVMLLFGALTGVASQPLALGQPTPWLGCWSGS